MKLSPAVACAVGICVVGCPTGSTPDAGTDPDAAARLIDAGPFDCFALLNCTNSCAAPSCFGACAADSTPDAQYLNTTLQDCLTTNCPATDGGPCAQLLNGDCQTCTQNAQVAGAPCAADLVACIDDMSGSAGDLSGPGCNSLTLCLDGCQSVSCEQNCIDAVSSVANQLYTILMQCLTQSCPATDGGACTSPSSGTCETCLSTVLSTGGTCSAAYGNCQSSM